ncbi:OBG GTPase family GTP-binding protein [Candidatus Nanohalococcus occultus]|uniref:OBG GTPase family GTP-binding protein n=1 Tax=Candidatus Nanohalococcus occultus TaxID=2978047 RepID=UPI0039DF6E46
MGIEDKIQSVEEKLEKTPINKATEKERARLKSRIAELKEQKQKKAKGTGDTSGYAVEKHGDVTAALVGFPSVGKSTLLNEITNADSDTGAYEFTTLDVNPGMMDHKGAKIQVLDVPGLIGGAADGRGGGKQVLSVVRNAEIVLIVLDPEEMREDEIKQEVYNAGIRINTDLPNMKIEKKDRGGIKISKTVDGGLEEDTIRDLMRQHGYANADVVIREEMDIDRFIDGLMDNRKYIPAITAVNKIDMVEAERRKEFEEKYDLVFSAETGENLDKLKDLMFDRLELIRVYMKEKGEDADKDEPLILRKGATVEEAMNELPGEMKRRFKDARVSGPSSKFPNQRVGMEHELMDEDVLELNLKHL